MILLLALPALLGSQSEDGTDPFSGVPRLLIKTDVAHLIYPNKPAVSAGIDFAIASPLRADLTLGWFLGSGYFSNFKGETYNGPRLRLGWKYIWALDKTTFFHLGMEGRYDRITNREWANVSRQGQQYVEIFLRNRQIESLGAAFRMGLQLYFGETGRWLIEPECHLGLARHDVWYQDPPDVELASAPEILFNFRFPEGRSYRFNPAIAVHVGYALLR
ncbi:MAG: hypothetical protein K9I85_14295 [Saprospiraceae bacterium]|nr:hypothetical protein [Saprospiraceae bacterium]